MSIKDSKLSGFLGTIGLLAWSVLLAAPNPYQHREIFWEPAAFGPRIVGLYHLDELAEGARQAANANPAGAPAVLLGDASPSAAGRFAGGIQLNGAGALRAPCTFRNATLHFSLNLDELPAQPTPLLTVFSESDSQPPIRVELRPDGGLAVYPYKLPPITSEPGLLQPGQWRHVALVLRAQYTRDAGWLGDVELHVDGRLACRLLRQKGATNQQLLVFSVGGAADGSRGISGVIDEVVAARQDLAFYDDELAWVAPQAPSHLELARPWMREPIDQVLSAAFDQEELENPLPGVEGDARRFGQGKGGQAWSLPDLGQLPAGAISFWLRPLDWDNLKQDNPFDRQGPASIKLLTLEGKLSNQSATELATICAHLEPPAKASGLAELTPGAWTHVAFTWQGEAWSCYLNGKLHSAKDLYVQCPHWSKRLSASQLRLWGDQEVATAIDDLRLFSRALSPPELHNLVARRNATLQPQPLPEVSLRLTSNGVVGWVQAEIWPLGEAADRVVSGTLTVTNSQTGKPLGKADIAFEPDLAPTVRLDCGPFDFGTYDAVAELRDAQGKVLLTGTASFTREKPPWYGNTLGISDQVMPGWTPIQVDGQTLSVTRRTITLGATGLPGQIQADGEDILAQPVNLELPWPLVPEPLTITAANDVRADWQAAFTAGPLRGVTRGYLEYDGMMWFDLTLTPREGATAELDTMTLRITYPEANASLVHWWGGDMAFKDGRTFRNTRVTFTGDLPAGSGTLFRSNDSEHVWLPPELRGSFIPYVMLTGMHRGLAWFAESDRGWTKTTDSPAVSIERHDGMVTLLLRIICEPTVIDQPRTISFGLHPIPVKPLPADWRMHASPAVYPDHMTGNSLKGPRDSSNFNMFPDNLDWDQVQKRITGDDTLEPFAGRMLADYNRERQAFVDLYHREPHHWEIQVPGLYFNQAWVGNFPPHSEEWRPVWYRKWQVTYDRDLLDYQAYALDQWITHTHGFVRGIYLDDTWPAPQTEGPLTYTLADGHVQPAWQWRNYRQRYKRMRQIFVDRGIDFVIMAHNTNTYCIPYQSWIDLAYDGEWLYAEEGKPQTFLQKWPLGRLRFMHHVKWGIPTTWLDWSSFSANYHDKYPAWAYRQERSFTAAMALHDIEWNFGSKDPVTKPSKLIRDFQLLAPDTRFLGYWENQDLFRHHQDALRVSLWQRPDGRTLAILVNTGDQRLEASVEVQLPGTLQVRDVDPDFVAAFKEDITTLKQPPAPREHAAPLERERTREHAATDLDFALEEPEKAAAQHPDAAFSWQPGKLSCVIRPYDYRLFLFTPQATGSP